MEGRLTVSFVRTPGPTLFVRLTQLHSVPFAQTLMFPLADMVPPFLAYNGVASRNTSLIKEAYTQCALYRDALQDPTTQLWKHIVKGNWEDNGLWGTGSLKLVQCRVRKGSTLTATLSPPLQEMPGRPQA
jgi:hypothetical protein